jgi:hypothetical protein
MYPVVNQNPSAPAFWDQVTALPGMIESQLPTMDKSLDAYFDTTFASVIEEWELLTETDLHTLEARLSRVTDEISTLYADRLGFETRAARLDLMVTSLEESL